MRVDKLHCRRFRNIVEAQLLPCDGMNVICGENAQGKTNLIEAIWLFTGAKSFRTAKENTFLMLGEQKGQNELTFYSGGVENNASMEFSEKRQAFLNEKQLSNSSKLAGCFTAIVFSPSDLSLVEDGPGVRRRFLDLAIGQLYPNYIDILRKYSRAVVQRNQIIKDFRYDGSLAVMLDVFEAEIVQNGKKIIEYRKRYLEMLKRFVPDIYFGLSTGREQIGADYLCSCEEKELEEGLKGSRREDMYTGVTSVGPHRDDIQFEINGISARIYGSQGQKRSVALALKLTQAEVLKNVAGEYPVCLLDDVMSELDPARQNYVLNHIRGWQSFLTCCDPTDISGLKDGKSFTVRNGGIYG